MRDRGTSTEKDESGEKKVREQGERERGNRFLVTSWELETAAAQPLLAITANTLSSCQ